MRVLSLLERELGSKVCIHILARLDCLYQRCVHLFLNLFHLRSNLELGFFRSEESILSLLSSCPLPPEIGVSHGRGNYKVTYFYFGLSSDDVGLINPPERDPIELVGACHQEESAGQLLQKHNALPFVLSSEQNEDSPSGDGSPQTGGVLSASTLLLPGGVLCRVPAVRLLQIHLSQLRLSLCGEFLYFEAFLLFSDFRLRLVCLYSVESSSPALHSSAGVATYSGDQLGVS